MCEDGYGAFLSASNILTVSHSTSASSMPTMPSKKLMLSCEKTKSGRDFYEDDQVVVFDKDGKRVPGVAKWACPGKEYGMDDYIIGIETVRVWVALIQLGIGTFIKAIMLFLAKTEGKYQE